jgi:hypothetical protein
LLLNVILRRHYGIIKKKLKKGVFVYLPRGSFKYPRYKALSPTAP